MRRPGLALLALAGLCLGLHVWLALGLFVPIARDTHIEYVLVSARFETFLVVIVLGWTAVFGVHLLLRLLASRQVDAPPLFSIEDTRYAWPLCLFAVSLLDLLNLVPSLNPDLPVLSYLLVDLRWWWTLVVLVWTAMRADDRFGGLLRHWFIRRFSPILQKRGVPETALVVIAVTWVVASTPELRFSGSVDGDEPKYLRYCENFYQGLGFEVTSIQPIAALPAGFTPQFSRDLVLLETILPGELRQLNDDTRAWIGDPSRRFNRASSPGNWF